jgi:hypothetical protein
MDTPRRLRQARAAILLPILAIVLVACTAGATAAPSTAPSGSPAGGSPGASTGEPGAGSPGGPGSGDLPTTDPDPDPGGGIPDAGGSLVLPKPNVINPQPVVVSALAGQIVDGRVVVRVDWTSGVEPCYTLAGVDVQRDGDTFTLTVLEGTTDPNAACIEIAMFKATLVDLGQLPTGSYTVEADPGDAAPITITVP